MVDDSDRCVRFSIVGAGAIGRVHARAIACIPRARLTVVGSRNPQQGRALADEYGALWVPDYGEAAVHPQADVVCVCTPTGTHAQVAVGAAEAGKHLVVEKPLDVTLERADQIIAAARAAQVKFTTVFPYRFMAGSAAARRAVGAGRLGRLTLVEGRIAWYRSQEYYDGGGWRGTWHLDGGGALMNQSIHTIDLLQWLAGPVRSVYGRVATLTHRMETEDTAVAVLALKDGGLGVIEGATSCWPGEPARVTLRGERGTIALQEGRIVTWRLADSTAGEEESMLALEDSQGSGSADPAGISCEQHRRQIADMVDAIWDDRAPMVDGAEGRKVLEIILAIYRASQSGQPVEVS